MQLRCRNGVWHIHSRGKRDLFPKLFKCCDAGFEGGCVEKRAMRLGLSLMPDAWIDFGSSPGSTRPRLANALIMLLGCPMYPAAPASARNSRWRENQATIMEARMPNTIWQTMEVTTKPMP